jgi:hypothetical protein
MKIQMNAAIPISSIRPRRRGSQRVRIPSYESKKYSNVFGKTSRSARICVCSKSTTADQPVVVQEPPDVEAVAADPVAHHREVRERQVVDVERLVVRLVAVERQGVKVWKWSGEPVDDERASIAAAGKRKHASGTEDARGDDREEHDRVGRDVEKGVSLLPRAW